MKKSILILVAFLFTQLTLAQLRKSYSEIHKLYPEATSKDLRAEGSFLVEDLIVSKDEKKMIMYTKDSIAIAVGTLNNNFMDEAALEKFVYRYNNERYHESLNNLTPADVYFGRGELILKERERLKKMAIINRRNEYQKSKLSTNTKNHLSLNY